MKGFLLLLVSLFVLAGAQAQTQASYSETTVVKDTTGFVYPYGIWSPLVAKGTHMLVPEEPGNRNTAYFIVRKTEQEMAAMEKAREARLEKLPKPSESEYFKNGQAIKLYDLVDIDGNPLKLTETKGKVIVLNFWFVKCPPCKAEIPELNRLVEHFKGNPNVIFAAIALDNKRKIQDFLGTNPFKYQIVEDGRLVAGSYGIELYPTHVVIDGEGKVAFHTSGLAQNTVYWIKKSIKEVLEKSSSNTASK
jgi:thiol-disulfide isomerase/thioredoxin